MLKRLLISFLSLIQYRPTALLLLGVTLLMPLLGWARAPLGVPFTPGNIVVVRVGDNAASLSTAAAPVFLDEYNITTGALVQSFALPATAVATTTGNAALTIAGSSGAEGLLGLSTNGLYLSLAGYNTSSGTASVGTTTTVVSSAANNRIVGRVSADGTLDTSTRLGDGYSGASFRSAISTDGSGFWTGGAAGGVRYVPFANATGTATTVVSTTPGNNRVVGIANGQLYVSAGASPYFGITTVGTGLPTNTGNTAVTPAVVNIAGSGVNQYMFFDLDPTIAGVDVVYMADNGQGKILKYTFDGTTWTAAGTITQASVAGLTAVRSATSNAVTFYATSTTTSTGAILKYTDPNTTIAGSITGLTPTTFAAGPGTNKGFRGLTFAPEAAPGPQVFVSTAGTLNAGSTASGTAGTTVVSYDVSGRYLTAPITVMAPTNYEVSLSSGSGFAASVATANPSSAVTGGLVGATRIYVRLKGTGTAGTIAGNVTNVSGTASQAVAVTGTLTASTPFVLVTNSPAITAFTTQVGTPSAAQTYTVQVGNLTNALVVTAPTGFEVSSDGLAYAPSLNLGTTATTYTIRVRLTGAARGTFGGNVANESTGANTPNNVAVTGTTVAAPATYYLVNSATDPAVAANFNTVVDGSGITLTGFDVENATLRLAGPATLTPGAAIGPLGSGSKFVLGDGTAAIMLTLPATGAEFTAPLDLAANATLQMLDLTPSYTLGAVAVASTIDFAQAGTFAVPQLAAPGYGNLKLTGGTKTFLGNTTLVRGSLVAYGVTSLNGATAAPFSTLDLKGNFTLLNGTTFDPSDVGRFTLLLSSGTTQVLTGNGTDFALFRLTTATSGTAVVLATSGGNSHLVLSNATGTGGYTLATGTTLTLNGNNLTFVAGGNTSIGSGNGTLLSTAGSTLTYNHSGSNALGTLRLGAGERPARVVLNATGTGATLALPANAGTIVLGGLTLTAGTLDLGAGNTLQLDGPVTVTAGLLQGSATSGLSFTGTSPVTGSLGFTAAAGSQLQALTLNQAANTLIGVANSLTIANLTLTKGSLFFTPFTQAIVATLNGGNADSFVNALTLATPAAATATLTFPLGASVGGFRPVVLAATQAAATATAYAARATDGNTTSRGLDNSAVGANPPLTRTSSARYYSLSEAGTSNFVSGTLTLAFGGGDSVTDLPSLRIARSANASAPFADINPGSTPTTATSGTAGGGALIGTVTDAVTALGDFALATTSADLAVNPLPVELVAFTARRAAPGVTLSWVTASEQNSADFEVQRSRDGHEFTLLVTMQAQGNSTQATVYAALDKAAPAGKLYYRLRQLDRDGRVTFSPLVAVADAGEVSKVELYPNPAQSLVSFITETATPYRVLNQLGQLLVRGITEAGTASIGLGTLPPGLYFLELQTAAGRTVQKFEKE